MRRDSADKARRINAVCGERWDGAEIKREGKGRARAVTGRLTSHSASSLTPLASHSANARGSEELLIRDLVAEGEMASNIHSRALLTIQFDVSICS